VTRARFFQRSAYLIDRQCAVGIVSKRLCCRNDIVAQPCLDGTVTLAKRTKCVSQHFAVRCVVAACHLRAHEFGQPKMSAFTTLGIKGDAARVR